MDINVMVLSLGNTRVAVGVFVAGKLEYVKRLAHAQRGDWPAVIAQAWEKLASSQTPAVAGASVNPNLVEPLEQAVRRATGQDIQWVGRQIDLPIKVLTEQPQETGVDRILNLAAAYEQMQKACVVVDAGTAITVDCCNDRGEFLGGAIAPGVGAMLDALKQKTAQLPRVEFDIPQGAFGRSTQQAILHGVYHGVRGMVKELAENYAAELGGWPEVIATGGDAVTLFDGWEIIHAVAPDLLLYGIASAYADHHIKHGT